VALTCVGGEQRQHSLVVGAVLAGQRPADRLGQVVVTHRDGVGVSGRALAGLGRRPRADAGEGTKPGIGFGVAERGDLLQPGGDLGGVDDRARADPLDACPVPVPGRDPGPDPRRREDTHAGGCRAGGWRAVLEEQRAPGPVRLLADDLLLEDGGNERFEDAAAAADAQARKPAGDVSQQLRARAIRVRRQLGGVERAELRGELVQHPAGTRAPGLCPHRAVSGFHETERGGAVRGQRGAPERAVAVGTERGVAAAVPVHAEREPQADRKRRPPVKLHGCYTSEEKRTEVGASRVPGQIRMPRASSFPLPMTALSPMTASSTTAPASTTAPRPRIESRTTAPSPTTASSNSTLPATTAPLATEACSPSVVPPVTEAPEASVASESSRRSAGPG